jgi:uncharacterized protein (TIGR02145 family)
MRIKRIVYAIFLWCSFYTATAQVPSNVPTNGLVGYWPFSGNANDASSNGNNGTVNGASLTTDRNGNANSAYNFSGGSNISIPMTLALHNLPNRTFSCWFNANGNQSGGRIYETTYLNGGIAISGNILDAWYSNGPNECNVTNVNSGNLNQWHNLVYVTTNTGLGSIYIDGVLINSRNGVPYTAPTNWLNNFMRFGIGAQGESFNGKIDDIGIWNRALTQQEISSIYYQTTSTTCLPDYVPTNGLVGYWPFCGNANDASSNGNNGTVNGASLTTDRNGNANSAYNFDGINDYIQVPHSSSISLTGDITMSAWVKTNGSNGQNYQTIISKRETYWTWEYLMTLSYHNSIIHDTKLLSSRGVAMGNQEQGWSTTPYSINNWENWVVTISNNQMKIYKNGVLDHTQAFSLVPVNQVCPLLFGKNTLSDTSEQFKGNIDDIGIWNRALTAQEIANLYNPCATPPAAPVAAATQTFCASPAPTVASLTATGTGIQWYAAATGGTALASTTTLVDGTTYYASQTVNGCESTTRFEVTVDFNDPQITASATTVCSGNSVFLGVNLNSSETSNNSIINYSRIIGDEIFVSPNGDDTPTNGTIQLPFKTIQYAINSAQNNQIVTLKDGVYNGVGNRNINLLGKKLIIQSENGPYSTIIDCEQSERGFKINQGETHETIIQGLTIKNGKTISAPIGYGSAVFVEDNSSILIKNCVFESNLESTLQFGDTEVAGGQSFVTNCIFRNNLRSQVSSSKKTVTVENCLFENNISLPGEICGNGHASNPPSYYKNCIFRNNQADIIIGLGHSKSLINCLLYNNTTTYGTVYMGTCWSGINIINHCTFYNNICNYYDSNWYDHIGQVHNSFFSGPNSSARNHVSGNQGRISYSNCIEENLSFMETLNANLVENIGVDILQLPNLNYNATYLWSTSETTSIINPTPTATTTYWCDVTVNGLTCRKEITITVNTCVIPDFTPIAPICSGATLAALPTTSNNGIFGTWTPELNTTATTTYTFTPNAEQLATPITMTIIVNGLRAYYIDADGDGIGAGAEVYGCLDEYGNLPSGYSFDNSDCNDNDANFSQPSNWYGDVYIDADGDGVGAGEAVSVCLDQNLNPPPGYSWDNRDCNDNDANYYIPSNWYGDVYIDADGDGFGSGNPISTICMNGDGSLPGGYSFNNSDCNDNDANYGYSSDIIIGNVYIDADGDGIGAGEAVIICLDSNIGLPPGYSSDNYDCNDNDANFLLPSNWYGNVYIDADGDGFGSGNPTSTCMSWDYNLPQGYSWNNYDCDDHFFSSNGLCPLTLNVKLYLQGYYKSNQNQMTPLRKNAGVSPSQDEVDEVTVSLYSKYDLINPIIAAATAVVGTNGIVGLKFAVLPDEYYILVEHKNTIKTWSATPVAITNGTTYDFTTAASQAYGNNQIEVASGIYAIYSGDMNQDGTINEADLPVFTIANTTAAHGYVVSDLNGDGSVDLLDYPIYKNNAAASVNAVRPVPLPIASLPNVTIGTQVWQSTNLNVATYRDGTPIPQVTDPTAWANLTTGAWCYYNNTIANDTTYGKLYNWYAVAGIHDNDPNTPNKILAPEGWHVPTDAEWTKLTTFLGGDNVAGGKMKATGTSLWLSPNTGATNSSSFTGLPAGCRLYGGTFGNGGANCDWWSSSESEGSTTSALNRYLGYGNGNAWRGSRNKGNGFSVRCLRD